MDESFTTKVGETLESAQSFEETAQEFCTVLRHGVKHYNWVGIYMIEDAKTLVLKAWNGPAATEHIRIPVGEGICGAAAQEGKTIIVDDVKKDPRYLQCFLHGIVTREDLAELATDDLLEINEMDSEDAAALIMKARAHWFEEEQQA